MKSILRVKPNTSVPATQMMVDIARACPARWPGGTVTALP